MRPFRAITVSVGIAVTFAAAGFTAAVEMRPARHLARPPVVWTPPDDLPLPAAPQASTPPRPLVIPSEEPMPIPHVYDGRYAVPRGRSAPMIDRIKIAQRAVFITIDDGNYRDQRVLDLIDSTHLPVSAFLVGSAVDAGRGFWQAMARAGVMIEDHTLTHPRLTSLDYAAQKRQICGPTARFRSLFGRRPELFRPPYGSYDARTLRAVDDCGLRAAVNWSATFGGGVLRTWGGGPLRPGDIVLLHFKPGLYDDLLKLMRILKDRKLGVGLLESYLAFAPRPNAQASSVPSPYPSPSPSASPSPSTLPLPSTTPEPGGTPARASPSPHIPL